MSTLLLNVSKIYTSDSDRIIIIKVHCIPNFIQTTLNFPYLSQKVLREVSSLSGNIVNAPGDLFSVMQVLH